MITRSMVASGRWVTATKDANSIHASLASAAGELGRTHVSSDDSRGMLNALAAPGKSILLTATPMLQTEGTQTISVCEVYNRRIPGSMPFGLAGHFPAVPFTMEYGRGTNGMLRCTGHRPVSDCRWAGNRVKRDSGRGT